MRIFKLKGKITMENKQTKLNKAFRFNSNVYVVRFGDYCDYCLVKGRVVGVREFRTAYSDLIYTIDTGDGCVEALPCNIYESVQEFIDEAKQRVVE